MCQCAEGKLLHEDGSVTDIGLGQHNCDYIRQRNLFILPAEIKANHEVRYDLGKRDENQWARSFFRVMNELWWAQEK